MYLAMQKRGTKMDKQLNKQLNKPKQIPKPTQIKVTAHSTFSSRSFSAYKGYIPSMLSSFNWNLTPKLTITDWKENSNLILEIKKLPNKDNLYSVTLKDDCYYEVYTNMEELIFAVVTFIETNLLTKENWNGTSN